MDQLIESVGLAENKVVHRPQDRSRQDWVLRMARLKRPRAEMNNYRLYRWTAIEKSSNKNPNLPIFTQSNSDSAPRNDPQSLHRKERLIITKAHIISQAKSSPPRDPVSFSWLLLRPAEWPLLRPAEVMGATGSSDASATSSSSESESSPLDATCFCKSWMLQRPVRWVREGSQLGETQRFVSKVEPMVCSFESPWVVSTLDILPH